MHNYNVGDRVRVRSDLVVDRRYGDNTFVEAMTPLRGKVVTIKSLFCDSEYTIEEDSKYWTNEMLEGKEIVNKHKIGDKVTVRGDLEYCQQYGANAVNGDMMNFKGQEVTIKSIVNESRGQYTIEEADWTWTNEMFIEEAEGITTPEGFDDYKVGDKVKVKSTLMAGDRWKCCGTTIEMAQLRGKIVTIKTVRTEHGAKYYTIEETHYNWVSEMFEGRIGGGETPSKLINADIPLKPIEVGDRVRVKRNINTDMSFQGWSISEDMVDLRGSIITITYVGRDSDGIYYESEDEDEDELTWTIDMIERLDIVPKSSEAGIIKAMKNFSDEDLEWEIERRRKQV